MDSWGGAKGPTKGTQKNFKEFADWVESNQKWPRCMSKKEKDAGDPDASRAHRLARAAEGWGVHNLGPVLYEHFQAAALRPCIAKRVRDISSALFGSLVPGERSAASTQA